MIADALLGLLGWILSSILDPLGNLVPEPPGWAYDGFAAAHELWDFVQGFSAWIPVTLTFTVAAGVLGAYAIGVVIQLVRSVLSYLTFGGGAT